MDITDVSLDAELAKLLAPLGGEPPAEMLKAVIMGQLAVTCSMREEREEQARALEVVLDALEGMVAQHCAGENDLAEHQFISANEAAFDVLLAAGRLAYVGLEVYRFTTEEERQ